MAPTTKYGGKIVVCHPGNWLVAKSNDTTECTESTSGVHSPARIRYAFSNRCQWRHDPVHPTAKMPYATCLTRLVARSRRVARSGIMPMYQNSSDTLAYVLTANTSHSSGLRNCGHMSIWFGSGNSQYASHGRPTWIPGNIAAHTTAKIVIASANRLMPVRQFCRNRNKIALISVPAWPMPTQNTKFTMSNAHATG